MLLKSAARNCAQTCTPPMRSTLMPSSRSKWLKVKFCGKKWIGRAEKSAVGVIELARVQ